MEDTTIQQINDLLSAHQKVGVAIGKNPTIDTMGAALSLFLSLREAGKDTAIACPTSPIVEISSLVGIDAVKDELAGSGGDLIVSFPYKEGEIDKVSYTLEQGSLNIIVKAGELGLSFQEQDVQYKRSGGLPSLLFVVGTPNLSDLGSLFDPEALKDTVIVNIDNKNQNQGYGNMVLVSPDFSSVSEQIATLLLSLDLPLNIDTAQNLLSGISFATDNFQSTKTSAVAFEMAGALMKKGALRKSTVVSPLPINMGNAQIQAANKPFFGPAQQNPRQGMNKNVQSRGSNNQRQGQRPSQQPAYQARQNNRPEEKEQQAPPDWLTPKVYKGSSNS